MTAQEAIDRALSATRHWEKLAPNAPLERFIAQEILQAQEDAFSMAGWYHAADRCAKAIGECGDTEIPNGMVLENEVRTQAGAVER